MAITKDDAELVSTCYSYIIPFGRDLDGEGFARLIESHFEDGPATRKAAETSRRCIRRICRHVGDVVTAKFHFN